MFKDETTNEEKITRCGACGEFQQNPAFYSQKEQDEAELIHCGCENNETQYEPTLQEMVSQGVISLDSQGNPF